MSEGGKLVLELSGVDQFLALNRTIGVPLE